MGARLARRRADRPAGRRGDRAPGRRRASGRASRRAPDDEAGRAPDGAPALKPRPGTALLAAPGAAAAFALGCGAAAVSAPAPAPPVGAEAPAERRGTFVYEAAVRGLPAVAGRVAVWIPLPVEDERQTVSDLRVEAPAPHEVVVDPENGNRFARVVVEAGGRDVEVAVRFRLERRAYRALDAAAAAAPVGPPPEACLGPDRLVPVDGPPADEARHVAAGASTPVERARALYDHVVSTMRYDKSGPGPDSGGWGRGDALYACEARRGNCTDFHSLFIAQARALGIPARFAMGVPLPAEAGGEAAIAGYHCWAEFWVDGLGWVPVDASEAAKRPERRDELFGGLDADRVLFTYGRDVPLPGAAAPPLNYVIYPHVEVDGRPHRRVETRFSFRPEPA